MGVAQSDPNDPLRMTDFGSDGVPSLAIPYQQSELDFTNENFGKNGQRVVIWPICMEPPITYFLSNSLMTPKLR